MDAETIKYETFPFSVTLAGVVALEFFAMAAPVTDLLLLTGMVRGFQSVFILWMVFHFSGRAIIPGLTWTGMTRGIIRGCGWSVVFGLLAFGTGIVLWLSGLDPFAMISVRVPPDKTRLIAFFVVAGFIGPFAEELFFRGVIYGFLRKYGMFPALAGSTVLFVLAHSMGGIALTHVIGGLVFAAAYEHEKNIMVPVVIHVLGNVAIFSVGFLS